MNRRPLALIARRAIATGAVWLAVGCASPPAKERAVGPGHPAEPQSPLTLSVEVPSGKFDCDVYLPAEKIPAPLVVVAHGFSRSKTNMADWGRCLAREGFAAAVPTLPAWSDHARNGRAMRELVDWLQARPELAGRLDTNRVALMGFSAGGLSSLLAAADNPGARVWIGLDPVDRDGQGAAAASRVTCPAFLLRAEPAAWNAYGNAAGLHKAFATRCLCLLVPGATHADPEWPADAKAEWVCGQSSPPRRPVFVRYAVAALRSELLKDPSAAAILAGAGEDKQVRVLPPPK